VFPNESHNLMYPGGIADKLGNRYEAKWLVRQLLSVIAENADWLRFEGISPEFDGFEFSVYRNDITEWHQTKINAPSGNWTIGALKREGVLSAFKQRLDAPTDDRCIFVSQDSAKDIRALSEKAGIANNALEFTNALSQAQNLAFTQLTDAWDADNDTAFEWLKRCEFLTYPEKELESTISAYSDLYFESDNASAFPELRDYLEEQFNKTLTTESVRSDIRTAGKLTLKDWALDSTLRERLSTATDDYLNSYNPFGAGGTVIPREQIDDIFNSIGDLAGPSVILVTGVAGSGKSGVIRGLIEQLKVSDITHLAFRADHHLESSTAKEIGQKLTDRYESPVSTLKGIEPQQLSVIIIDQVDAVSEVSGRIGTLKQVVLRIVSDSWNFETTRVVLVCRSFDLDSDPRLKTLTNLDRVKQIEIPLLDWDRDVKPVLSEKNIDTNQFAPKQKELLLLPLHLALYLEVNEEGQDFSSRHDLFEKLIQVKARSIRQIPNVTWAIKEPLTMLAQWMSNRQLLDAPQAVLDQYTGAQDLLASEGLIVISRNNVNFFHESFFDYLYADTFVVGEQTLIELLASTEQHLFRRTQTRQILEAIRQHDQNRYLSELESVITGDTVRYHIKVAVSQWLGSLSDPTGLEKDIMLSLDINNNNKFSYLVRQSLLSTPGWFDLLSRCGWIQDILNGDKDERRNNVLWWLSDIAGHRPEEIAEILDTWWDNDPERAKQLLGWFSHVRRQKPDQALITLCERVIRSKPPGLFDDQRNFRGEMLLAAWAEKEAVESAGILKALFDSWFDEHPGQHPFERDNKLSDNTIATFGDIATKAPITLIEGTIDMLVKSLQIDKQRKMDGNPDYIFEMRTYSGYRFGADAFLGYFRSALQQIADDKPELASKYLTRLDATQHEILLHLHLEIISVNGSEFAEDFSELLDNDKLFEAGWHGAEWKSFADAAKATFPYLTRTDRQRTEDVILSYQPELDAAVEIAKEIKEHGEDSNPWCRRSTVIHDLNHAGYIVWCVLETIGDSLLSTTAIERLKQLRRKFPGQSLPEPSNMEAQMVGPPIKRDNTSRMNDRDWLQAMLKYNKDGMRQREPDYIYGGARQLAVELQQQTKENPVRFAKLLMHIPDNTHQAYITHILMGLAEAEEVDEDLLKDVVINVHARPDKPYGDGIARLFELFPQLGKDTSLFKVLTWYAEHGTANEDEIIDHSRAEREIISINDLLYHGSRIHIRGINGERGRAIEAIAAVIWKAPEHTVHAWEVLEGVSETESSVSIKCCIMRPLIPLFNNDQGRCANLVEKLIEKQLKTDEDHSGESNDMHLAPLITQAGTQLLPYLIFNTPEIGRRLVYRLLESSNENMRLIGAWHIFCHSFQDSTYMTDADQLMEQGIIYRRLAADVAAQVIVTEEFRDRAEAQLLRFFNDDDSEVRKHAASVFRNIKPDEFQRFYDLAKDYLESMAFHDESFAFSHALKEATCSVYELVTIAAEKVIEIHEQQGSEQTHNFHDLYQIQDLLKQEYAATETNPEQRKKILDVIDIMLEKELHGTDKILKAHERE